MKTIIVTLVLGLMVTGCGQKGDTGDKGDTGIPGIPGAPGEPGAPAPTPTPPPPVVDEAQADIDEMIAYKNAERAVTAQAPLTKGLSCVVQQVASGQCLSASSTAAGCSAPAVLVMTGTAYTYLYKGPFNQPDATSADPDNLLPPSLRGLFLGKNYKISCTGFIVVLESNYYDFTLNSDDASILTINGGQVVNHDNNHGMSVKTGSALLYRNVQSFSLQYAQAGGGNHGMILQSGGALIDPKYYFH